MANTAQLSNSTLEYELAPHMVVFSHGFGIRRDSRGMFTEIAEGLPDGFGYVLFDYNEIDEQNHTARILDFAEQTAKLNDVLAWTAQQPNVETVSLIAHSMGCIVAALAQPKGLERVLFLAPPTNIGERTRAYFTGKKDAEKHDDMWLVPRSDGSISIIPETLFDQYEAVDAQQTLLAYADHQPYTLIAAGADKLLPDADYSALAAQPRVNFLKIDGAGHDFAESRSELLRLTRNILTRAV